MLAAPPRFLLLSGGCESSDLLLLGGRSCWGIYGMSSRASGWISSIKRRKHSLPSPLAVQHLLQKASEQRPFRRNLLRLVEGGPCLCSLGQLFPRQVLTGSQQPGHITSPLSCLSTVTEASPCTLPMQSVASASPLAHHFWTSAFRTLFPHPVAPLSLCVLIFISEAVALIPNPYGPMERSPVLRGYGSDISHILGTLRAWQTPAVTLNMSHGQAEDISPPCQARQVSGYWVWFGDRSSAVTWAWCPLCSDGTSNCRASKAKPGLALLSFPGPKSLSTSVNKILTLASISALWMDLQAGGGRGLNRQW